MPNPLCNLYFFSDPDADSRSPDMFLIMAKVKKAICDLKPVKKFYFVKETGHYVTLSEAVGKMKRVGVKRAFYPNAVIIRHDGAVMGLHLSSGRSVFTAAYNQSA